MTRNPFERFDDHDFRHWVAIQTKDGETDLVHRLLNLQDESRHSQWFVARQDRQEIRGYFDDIELAREIAERQAKGGAEAINLVLRYALLATSVQDLASNIKPDLIARFLSARFWRRDYCLEWAALARDPAQSTEVVHAALKTAEGRARHELGVLALDTAAAIADPDNRVLKIAGLAPDLAPALLPRALDIIAECDNEGSRSGGLLAIAERLPKSMRPQALRHAKQMRQSDIAVGTIVEIAALLEGSTREEAMAEALVRFKNALDNAKSRRGTTSFDNIHSRVLHKVPFDWLKRFADAAAQGGSWPDTALHRALENDPEAAVEALRNNQLRTPEMWSAAARGFVAAGQPKRALAALQSGRPQKISLDTDLFIELLRALPETDHPELLNNFRPMQDFQRETILEQLTKEVQVPTDSLFQLASQSDNEFVRLKHKAILIDRLDPEARENLIQELFTVIAEEERGSHILEDLAPSLTVSEVQRATKTLRLVDNDYFTREALGALVIRLGELTSPKEGLDLLNTIPGLFFVKHSELLGKLANAMPRDDLGKLLSSIQIQDDLFERISVRLTFAGHMSLASRQALLQDIRTLRDERKRLEGLAEITPHLREEAGLSGELLDTIFALLDRHEHHIATPLKKGFVALGQAARDADTTRKNVQSLSEGLSQRDVSPTWIARALLPMAEGTSSAAVDALNAVFAAIEDDQDSFTPVSALFCGEHRPAIERILRERMDQQDTNALLVPVFAKAVQWAAVEVHEQVFKAICERWDVDYVLICAQDLLPRLPQKQAHDVAADLARRPETWLQSEFTSMFAMSVLCPYAPDDLAEPMRDLARMLRSLHARDSIVLLPPLLSQFPKVRKALGPLIHELIQEDGPHDAHLDYVEEWITPEILRGVLAEVDAEELDRETRKSLLSQMIANGLVAEAIDIIRRIDNSFIANDTIEEIAPHCPSYALGQLASIVDVDLASAPLAIRAAACGDMDLAQELLPEGHSTWRYNAVETICRIGPIEAFDQLKELIETLSPASRAGPMTDLVLRLPRVQRQEHLTALLSSIGEFGRKRANCLQRLTADLASMPEKELTSAWIDALQRADTRDEIYIDLRGFGAALVERFGAEVAIALEHEVAYLAEPGWP